MYRLKSWCVEAVKAVSVLVSGEEANEEQPKMTIQLAAELEISKKGHNSVLSSKTAHVCRVCNVPCIKCVSLQGSSVDERGFHSHVSEFSKTNGLQASQKTAEVSTQTELLASNLEMTGFPQSTCLPDLLVTSSSSTKVLAPPPPPPPPPPAPPLPLKLQTAGATSSLRVNKKQQNALKKSQSAGVSVAPEITVEILRNVKLRKLKEVDKSHSNCSLMNTPAKAQPVVTLTALQKVTLRKTHSAKSVDLGVGGVQPEASGCHECGSEERGAVPQPRRIQTRSEERGAAPQPQKIETRSVERGAVPQPRRIQTRSEERGAVQPPRNIETRSSSGSPLMLKKRRQPEGEQQSVQCKQRRQSETNIRLLL
ncbi:hypothetical protein BsWGS_21276 [Bradybaena similaris]